MRGVCQRQSDGRVLHNMYNLSEILQSMSSHGSQTLNREYAQRNKRNRYT